MKLAHWIDTVTRRKRTVQIIIVLFGLLAAAAFIMLFIRVEAVQNEADSNSDKLTSAAAVARARGTALATANDQLTDHGLPAVTASPDTSVGGTNLGPAPTTRVTVHLPGQVGPEGPPGPGPSAADVTKAVTAYCKAHNGCEGKPTTAQVAAAVAAYCTGTVCTGPTGKPGQDATGVPGPPPSADQVAAAVEAYCSEDACRGPKGDPGDSITGPPGAKGQDAPRLVKVECSADNTWTFTLSDKTVLHADGPCRASTTTTTITLSPKPTSTTTPPAPTSTVPANK